MEAAEVSYLRGLLVNHVCQKGQIFRSICVLLEMGHLSPTNRQLLNESASLLMSNDLRVLLAKYFLDGFSAHFVSNGIFDMQDFKHDLSNGSIVKDRIPAHIISRIQLELSKLSSMAEEHADGKGAVQPSTIIQTENKAIVSVGTPRCNIQSEPTRLAVSWRSRCVKIEELENGLEVMKLPLDKMTCVTPFS